MKQILVIFLFFGSQIMFSQSVDYNLGFEKPTDNNLIQNWLKKNNGIAISLDSITKFRGKYSLNLSTDNEVDEIPGIENIIQNTFEGSEIELEGYLKTENIQSAYIYLVVGDDHNEFYFDMTSVVSGTNDWQKLNIKLPYTSEATKITIACNIQGSGQVWLDEFSLKIDGVNIYNLYSISSPQTSSSGFKIHSLSEIQINRLVIMGKVWGFLKYYHPNIAEGNYDLDKELFQILPIIKEDDFEARLEQWTSSFGEYKIEELEAEKRDIKFSPDFQWFEHQFITLALKNELNKILKAQRSDHNYYVGYSEESPSPLFENEKIYSDMEYDDDGMKLLALFRYWNYIEYFYPYKYLISYDWDSVLHEFVSKLHNTKDRTEYALYLLELMGKTEDTHHTILNNKDLELYFGLFKVPVSARFIDDKLVVVKSYFKENYLKEGDVIQEIEGVPIDVLKEKHLKYSVASNLPTTLRELAKKIIRTNKDSLMLTILREDKTLQINEKTISNSYTLSQKTITDLSNDVGYLSTERLGLKDYDSIFNKWHNKKAIIFDIRNYPQENLARLLPYLHEEPISFYRATSTSLQQPGEFSFEPEIVYETKSGYQFKGKIIILLNSESQSRSEFSALALRSHPNSIIIGNQTAGTDGDVSTVILPGNILTVITGSGIYHLDKSETQRVGIIPDIEIHPSLEDIKNNKDVILEAAIKEAAK